MKSRFDMDLQLALARERLREMDCVDGGPGRGEMALRTVLIAFASGLCSSQATDRALWDAYAMLEQEVAVQCGHHFGTYGMSKHAT